MPRTATETRDRLRALLYHGEQGNTQTARLFEHPVFTPVDTPSTEGFHQLTYQRLRVLNQRLGGGRKALDSPERLLDVLGHAAVIDPSLFLRAMVHYEVCLNAALTLGDDNTELRGAIDRLDSLAAVGGVLITEVGRGNSHVSVRTRAEYDPGLPGFRITTPTPDAAKFMAMVGARGHAQTGLVYARLCTDDGEHGVFPFLVDIRDQHGPLPGVRTTPLPHSRVSPLDHCLVSFQDAPVPFGRWLRDGAEISPRGRFSEPATHASDRLRRSLAVSSAASAAGATALAAATRATASILYRYSRHRVTTNTLAEDAPVIDYGIQQESVYGVLAAAYATTFMVRAARAHPPGGHRAESGRDDAGTAWSPWSSVSRELSLAKTAATAEAERACAEARRRCGAQGTLTVNRIPSYEALTHVYNSAGGENRLILLDVGRELALGGEEGMPSPAPPPDRSPRDPRMWSYLFREDERRLRGQARSVLGDTAETAASPQRWNESLWLLLALARAHTRRVTFETFDAAVASLANTPAGRALAPLFGLWSLDAIGDRAADHLAHGSLTPEEHLGMLDLRRSLLREVDAEALVDALDLPPEQLAAPIMFPDYARRLATGGS
ncbi:acyl-CoA dehydrogenase [Nocardiopsis sp. YSL2]|uniref:acyl-CoA dehydrogenase family protein n=1 Tax=Nocardiopsis sp. YSL2 TaxID=2939492 RepID=UPI0026F44691|nr:acyl-CoA dehydrogenase [Nocardiopsis sp. YSL2]